MCSRNHGGRNTDTMTAYTKHCPMLQRAVYLLILCFCCYSCDGRRPGAVDGRDGTQGLGPPVGAAVVTGEESPPGMGYRALSDGRTRRLAAWQREPPAADLSDHRQGRVALPGVARNGDAHGGHTDTGGSPGDRAGRPKRSPSATDDDGAASRWRRLSDSREEELDLFLALVKHSGSDDTAEECLEKRRRSLDLGLDLNLTGHFYASFDGNASAAVYTANLLSSFYSRQRSNASVFYNANCLYAAARTCVETHAFVTGACVAFDAYRFSPERRLYAPCVHADGAGTLVELDLGEVYDYTATAAQDSGHSTEWFTRFREPVTVQPPEVRWGLLVPRLNATLNGRARNTSYAFVGVDDGSWGPPYLDCNRTNRWLVTYSVPFFDHSFSFMGVVTVDVDVRSVDINQCDDGGGPFAGTHRCSNTTECVHIPGMGFRSGAYKCVCRDSYYFPGKVQPGGEAAHFRGTDVEREYRLWQEGMPSLYGQGLACLACRQGCDTCVDDSPCFVENDLVLRIVVLSCQGVCILLTGLLIFVIFKYKNLKVINCDSPWMLVLVLLGALLLYSELVAMFFTPTVLVCFMQRWLRGWGFAIAYGMLVLKIYRKLAIFQTRSATRVLVRDRDVLKWLVLIVIVLTGYLAAWTAFSVQSAQNCNVDIVTIGYADNGMKFNLCMMEWWDYVIEIIEFLFLLFGIYLCYSVRAAPSEFHETRYISIAIYNETIFSTFLYISRHILWGNVAPDWMYLMYFLRSQLTTTAMLALIFIPKLRVIHKLLHDESFRERVNSRVVYDGKWHNSFRRPNSSSSNANNDHNFSPEDVREELKRLYTQLEVYKTKSLRIDNPHLPSKKKSNVSKWRAPRRFSRGYSLRTHSGHSESERSSEIARSNESLGKAVELHDYRANHVDPSSPGPAVSPADPSHCSSQKWLCQQ